MNIKYKKVLLVAAIINFIVGVFLFVCGLLEFTGILQTNAHNVTETIGVNVSYLVFISAILIMISGAVSISTYNRLYLVNLQAFLGVLGLAWPLFLQISLFFTQLTINIRLVLTVLVALFYIIAILIVKISNDEFVKSVKFNPSAMIAQTGRRKNSDIVEKVFATKGKKVQTVNIVQSAIGILGNASKLKKSFQPNIQSLFVGKKRSRITIGKKFYASGRRRTSNSFGRLMNSLSTRRRPRRRF